MFKNPSCEIALLWVPQNHFDGESKLVQVMAWYHQAASHYLSQCWPRPILPYGITRQQWVNKLKNIFYLCVYVFVKDKLIVDNWVNIGSGNGLLSDGIKPLPEPMLTYNK